MFAGACYHVLNRANRKAEVFHESADYSAFLKLMEKAQEHVRIDIFAVCLMPNHIHLVVRPLADRDITRWMKWLFGTHSIHYHKKYATTGHVWQGRFKAVLTQENEHLLTVLRYVERNAMRANLVSRAEDWPWGSLNWRERRSNTAARLLTTSPVDLPPWWTGFVNQPQTAAELEAIRMSVNRQRPFGDDEWVIRRTADAGLEQAFGRVGRPRASKRSGTIS
jgi:putative transposase